MSYVPLSAQSCIYVTPSASAMTAVSFTWSPGHDKVISVRESMVRGLPRRAVLKSDDKNATRHGTINKLSRSASQDVASS